METEGQTTPTALGLCGFAVYKEAAAWKDKCHPVKAHPHCEAQAILFITQVRTGYAQIVRNVVIWVASIVNISHPSSPQPRETH